VRIAVIAAVADNGVIGDGESMPWRLSTDMRRFKALTMGKPVVMGRRTFETLPAPLKERQNMVVTRRKHYRPDGVEVFSSLPAALAAAVTVARSSGADEIMVIGGGEIYAQSINQADRLYITHVGARPEGETIFPKIDPEVWTAQHQEDVPAGERDSAPTRFVIYNRGNAGGQ
jgi:dihydrofolate reductase